MITDPFKPNDLEISDIENLEPWQLLLAACHFGPGMGDCRSLNYEYKKEDEELYCQDINLEGDIELKNPIDALERYAGLNWKKFAKSVISDFLKE